MRIIDGNIFEGMRMIIPEHREEMLRQEREKKRMGRPLLDQDKLERMSQMITDAIQDEVCITVTVYAPYGNTEVCITPSKVDPYARRLIGQFKDQKVSIPMQDIVEIRY